MSYNGLKLHIAYEMLSIMQINIYFHLYKEYKICAASTANNYECKKLKVS